MPPIKINDLAIRELVSDPNNGIGRFLERQADRVVAKTRKNLGRNYPPSGTAGSYPARRTGDLQDSLFRSFALNGPNGLFIDIAADAVHEGHSYSITLRDRGYVFITTDDLASLNNK